MIKYLWACLILASFVLGDETETACQAHRARASRGGIMKWDIQCDENGDYAPKSCVDDNRTPKWCTCYSKNGHQVRSPSRNIVACDCPVAEYEATEAGKSGCDVPQCKDNGEYEPKQCVETKENEDMYQCVNDKGEPTSEISANPPC